MQVPPAIELIDVHIALEEARVLRGVSFAVPAGEVTVLLGPSGVGKTTSLRAIVGLLEPDEGDVLVEGRSILALRRPARLALLRRFGVLLQGHGLYGSALWDSMTVEQNIRYQLSHQRPEWDEQRLGERCRERLEEVGLATSAGLMPPQLSAGMRRRAALARALVADPDFAVLDSFELGVDPVRLTALCTLLARRHEQAGGTYLIATQSMQVARELADNVVVLWDGRVIQEGLAEQVLDSDIEEVSQLISGSVSGPLGMEGEGRISGTPYPGPLTRPAEQGYELPIPLVAGSVLVAISASALWFGGAHPVELAVVAAVWLVAATLLWLRRQAVLRERSAAGEERRRR